MLTVELPAIDDVLAKLKELHEKFELCVRRCLMWDPQTNTLHLTAYSDPRRSWIELFDGWETHRKFDRFSATDEAFLAYANHIIAALGREYTWETRMVGLPPTEWIIAETR